MAIFSTIKALGSIAGALKSIVNWFREGRLMEAGRDDVRADIADQEAENDEEIRTIRNSVRNGSDADSVFHRFKDRRKE